MTEETSGGGLDVTLRSFAVGQKVFGRYSLIRTLGRGGMGVVWLARDDELERDVALKFLPELIVHDRAVLSELKRETKRSLELTHKNIVRIYDFVQDAQSACISMEYIDGDTLSNLRADRASRVFETRELMEWVTQLCEALDYAHNYALVVHRDLKPTNLMVNQRGDLKVANFGIARSLSDSVSKITVEGGTSGTLVYMSPQQLNGERGTHLDDVYSVGATIYDLLTSKPPFYSGNIDHQIRENIPPLMSARRKEIGIEGEPIAERWEKIVAACLQKEPACRPQSVAEIADRLMGRSHRARRQTKTALWKTILAGFRESHSKQGETMGRGQRRGIDNHRFGNLATTGPGPDEGRADQAAIGHDRIPADGRADTRSSNEKDPVAVQERVYANLVSCFGLDPKILREKLPKFADEWRHAPDATLYERANANYVARDYSEAERLAVQAADAARKVKPANSKDVLQAWNSRLVCAERGAIHARDGDFRDAEKLTDRNRNLEKWVTLQQEIADLLVVQGKYSDAEKLFRSLIEARTRALGPEDPGTLDSRHRLIYALARQTKYGEAETEARQVLMLREKTLGPENIDTLISRYNLGEALVSQGKNSEAETLYRMVIRRGEKLLGPEHPAHDRGPHRPCHRSASRGENCRGGSALPRGNQPR